MKHLSTLLLLLALACCAERQPEPAYEAAVFEPNVVCRAGHDGEPVLADRGIGGTGAPNRTRTTDRGIGGTGISRIGIFGVVTGFASVCVDGLEVRLDKAVPVSVDGAATTSKQLRVGQVVAIEAGGPQTAAYRATTIAIRYEVSGPIEAADTVAGAMMVAGQRVAVQPTTWMAGRFGLGDWVTVSGLRQADGTVMASRLDRARPGALFVRGQLIAEGGKTRVGRLVLHGPVIAIVKPGSFVAISGRYADGTAEVTAIDADLLADDPVGYFGSMDRQVVLQALVRVDRGMVWLPNGRSFPAGADVHGQGGGYRNAVVRLEQTASGSFIATALHYTAYRSRPADAPVRSRASGASDLVLPPEPPPGPPAEISPADAPDADKGSGEAPDSSPRSVLISSAAPRRTVSSAGGPAGTALPPGEIGVIE